MRVMQAFGQLQIPFKYRSKDEITNVFEFGKSHKNSSGIGLYYSKNFVKNNNGQLNISSLGKQKGATITIRFMLE